MQKRENLEVLDAPFLDYDTFNEGILVLRETTHPIVRTRYKSTCNTPSHSK